jgi:hypothetical protein
LLTWLVDVYECINVLRFKRAQVWWINNLMAQTRHCIAGLTEFQRDLIREGVNTGLAAARHRGQNSAAMDQRPSDKKASGCSACIPAGHIIAHCPQSGIEQKHVTDIVRRNTGSTEPD